MIKKIFTSSLLLTKFFSVYMSYLITYVLPTQFSDKYFSFDRKYTYIDRLTT